MAIAWRRSGRLKRLISTLAFEEVQGNGEQRSKLTAMLLHGLLGSGRNWRSFARRLSSTVGPDWRLVLVDLRNHGQSARIQFPPPHDIPSAARDLAELIKSKPELKPDILMGHSMGGKVALEFLKCSSEGRYGSTVATPKQLLVLDSVVGEVPAEEDKQGEVEHVLQIIQQLPNPIPSRRWLLEHLAELGFSKSLANWLGSNLRGISSSTEEATWVFNVKEALDMFVSYRKMDYWSLLERPPQGTDIGIVRALKSDRWMPHVVSRLEALAARPKTADGGTVTYRVLENAGHWLHVDNPEGLVELLAPSFHNTPRVRA